MSAEPVRARRNLWGLLFVVVFASGYAAWVLGATPEHQPGIDSHYHFRMGGEIASGTLVPDMAADLPLTVYRDLDVDHYWGFHVLLAPFAGARRRPRRDEDRHGRPVQPRFYGALPLSLRVPRPLRLGLGPRCRCS